MTYRLTQLDADIANLIRDYNRVPYAPYVSIAQLTADDDADAAPKKDNYPLPDSYQAPRPARPACNMSPKEYAEEVKQYADCLTTAQVAKLSGYTSEMVTQHRIKGVGGLWAHDITKGRRTNRNRFFFDREVVEAYVEYVKAHRKERV